MEFRLPALAEGIETAKVVRICAGSGTVVQPGQALLEVETDKVAMEVESPVAGRVQEVRAREGEEVHVGAVIMLIDEAADAVTAAPAAREERESERVREGVSGLKSDGPNAGPHSLTPSLPHSLTPSLPHSLTPAVPAGPATRRLARELGVDLARVTGSARGGRVTPEDVKAFVRSLNGRSAPEAAFSAAEAPPLPDFAQWGEIERRPVPGIRRKIAENLSLAWRLCPQVTQYDQADVTDLEAGRKRFAESQAAGAPKVTMTALAIKAVVSALKAFPQFNSSLDAAADEWIFKKYYHLGVAVDTEHGLLVPVLRDADQKSVLDLAQELTDVAERARGRKLGVEDLRGGTFTITNLGGIGGTGFSPIVNYPEVAILGIARSQWQSVVRDGKPEIRLMLPLCLSYDHRVIDGADGARFTAYVARALSDPVRLLMET
jgi:pyruvate dehydrogenase E2 component (dihydrolipoyllysine-residue acetyltransferase)